MSKRKKKRSGKAAVEARKRRMVNKTVKYKCLQCGVEEDIPIHVVRMFDALDDGDTSVPPRFDCEKCRGLMEPVEYEGVHGEVYRINGEESD